MGPPRICAADYEPAEGDEISLSHAYLVVRYAAAHLPAEYRDLIYSRWKRSLRYGNDYFRLIKPDAYYAAYDSYIRGLLAQATADIRLAVLSDDHDVVLGFSVVRSNVLDYVHVHQHQRRMGIGRALVPEGIDTITHITKTGLTIWGSKFPQWAFNPFA